MVSSDVSSLPFLACINKVLDADLITQRGEPLHHLDEVRMGSHYRQNVTGLIPVSDTKYINCHHPPINFNHFDGTLTYNWDNGMFVIVPALKYLISYICLNL